MYRASAPNPERLVDDVRDRLLVAGHDPGGDSPDEVGGQRGGHVLAEEARHANLPVVNDPGEAVVAGHRVQLEYAGQVGVRAARRLRSGGQCHHEARRVRVWYFRTERRRWGEVQPWPVAVGGRQLLVAGGVQGECLEVHREVAPGTGDVAG